MIKKTPLRGSDFVAVTFRSQAPEAKTTTSIRVLGDFNAWSREGRPMKLRKDGSWSVTLRLPRNRRFQFRYLLDGERWLTDAECDGLAPNGYGESNAVVST